MAVLGRHAWWLPGWLDKLLPDMDIEGNNLEKEAERGGHYRPTPRPVPQAQS
jgi:RND superfamily putative drug exporter